VVLLVMNNWNVSYIDMLSHYTFNTVGKGDGGFIPTYMGSIGGSHFLFLSNQTTYLYERR